MLMKERRIMLSAKHIFILLAVIVMACIETDTLQPASVDTHEVSESQVWFGPNIGSTDMLNLFTKPQQWTSTRSKIDVFKFYGWQLIDDSGKGLAGVNNLPNFLKVNAFSKLSEWNIQIAVEGIIIPRGKFEKIRGKVVLTECKSRNKWINELIKINKSVIRNVHSNGGIIRYLALDEPFLKAYSLLKYDRNLSCRYNNTNEIVDDVVKFIKQVQSNYPSVLIGDIEPYPSLSINQLKEWVAALESKEISLSFFHLDISKGQIAQFKILGRNIDLAADLQDLKHFLEARNISLGVIYGDGTWENLRDGYTDKIYYKNSIEFIREIKSAIGVPEHSIFQSWVEYPLKPLERKIPINLPESDPSVFSHTRLIGEGLNILMGK